MKLLWQILLIILCLSLFVSIVSAQIVDKNDTTPRSNEEQQRINQQRQNDALANRDRKLEQVNQTKDETTLKGKTKNEKEKLNQKRAKVNDAKEYAETLQEMLIAPAKYQEQFSDLLKNENMYLVRIYPDKNCDLMNKILVSVADTERCAGVIPFAGGGSKYSFKENTNVYYGEAEADIHFINDKFITGDRLISHSIFRGNYLATGIIAEIGDVNFQDINLSLEPAKFLTETKPKKLITEVREQNKLLEKGIKANGVDYSISAPLKLNSTYILRSIGYKLKVDVVDSNGSRRSIPTNKLKTAKDMLVAFKIVGQEEDGSIILLWKKLK